MTTVGVDVKRVDGPIKVSGQAQYTVDLQVPGMAHAKVLRSPYPYARIVGIDDSAARRVPGVTVATALDFSDLNSEFGVVLRDQPILAVGKVLFVGEPVAAVVAESADLAEECLDLIVVKYEPLPSVNDAESAMKPDAPVLHDQDRPCSDMFVGWPSERFRTSRNVCAGYHVEQGDVTSDFQASDFVFEDVYSVPTIQHGNLEPHSALAEWDETGSLTMYSSTQSPSIIRKQLAQVFNISESKVRVIVPQVGGAYGAKVYAKIEPLVAALARKARRPVKLVLSREEVFATAVRHAATVTIKTGVRRDGTILAREVRAVYDTGAYADTGPRASKKGGYLSGGPYRIRSQNLTSYCVYTNKPPAVAFRGFGVPQVCWAYESQMDDIARKIGMDPLALRLKNAVQGGDQFITGDVLDSVGLEAALHAVAERIGLHQPSGPNSKSHVAIGRGIACSIKSTSTPSNSAATVRMDSDGSVGVLTSSVEIGQGSSTALAQIVAETLSMPPEQARVVMPDTDVTPFDQSTISSRTTFSMGNATSNAALQIRSQLVKIAVDEFEIAEQDLEIVDGIVRPRDAPDLGLTFQELLRRHFGSDSGTLFGHGVFQTRGGLDVATGKGLASATWFFAAVGAEVAVDLETGRIGVHRLVTAADVGKAINPRQCHLQNEGSMLTGLGSTLFEEMVFDNGQPVNSSFLDYGLPSMKDHPVEFESILIETPDANGPFGARGVGESVISPVAPAIGNAVANALGGTRMYDLPLSPERVLRCIGTLHPKE